VTSKIRNAKRDYYKTLLDMGRTTVRAFWQHFRQVLPTKSQPSTLELHHKNSVHHSGSEIANAFNDHFSSIADSLIDNAHHCENDLTLLNDFIDSKVPNDLTFDVPDFCVDYVSKALKNLDVKKGAGLDGLQPKFLVLAADVIAPSLTWIFNLSLRTGSVPSIWKVAKVIPLYKNGAMSDPGNYRPISILPALSKIFERHIHSHLMTHLDSNNLLYKHQSGFRTFHSCQTALTSMVDSWASDIDSNKLVGILLIDLRKAFDLVNHNILLTKLKLYKCSDHCVSLFSSYLSDRLQQTQFQNHLSNHADLSVGVPQGSILGPLLFLLYVNDLHLISNTSTFHMFADDSTFCTSSSDIHVIEKNLESDLSNISKWCAQNQMSLHLGKTKSMLLTTRQKRAHLPNGTLSVNFSGTNVECVSSHKVLGVVVNENLCWKEHCHVICTKVQKSLFLLRKLKNVLPKSAKLQFYNSFILPHLDYCSTIWFNDHTDVTKPLNILQKRAMRLILNLPFDTPSSQLYKALNWMSIDYRCKFNICTSVFKSIHNLTPAYLSFFHFNSNRTRAAARGDLIIPHARKDIFKNTFRVLGAKLFNQLPSSVRDSPSLISFKRACFSHLISAFMNSL